MSNRSRKARLEEVYQYFWQAHDGEEIGGMEASLPPRPPVMLFELAQALGIRAGNTVLDLGCGRGNHALALAEASDCTVIGLDPVRCALKETVRAESGTKYELAPGAVNGAAFLQGEMESLPFSSRTFDLIWSRGALVHIRNLGRGLSECARVLKRHGVLIVETSVATDLMEPREAARLYGPLRVCAENMSRPRLETTFREAGLRIHSSVSMGGEPMEYFEQTEGRCSRELARLAKLVRARKEIAARIGETRYQVTLAARQWVVYHLTGKLSTEVYTLRIESETQG